MGKIAWLWPETLLLGRLVSSLVSWTEEVGLPVRVGGEILGWVACATLGFVGLVAVSEVLLRWPGPHYGRYLFTAFGTAASGFWVGLAMEPVGLQLAGERLFLAGLVFSILALGWLILLGFAGGARFKPSAIKGSLVWLGAACIATYLGIGMLQSTKLAATAYRVLETLAVVSPAGGLLLGWWLHPRLLKPFRMRQILDRDLPRALRWHLSLLTFSLFSPLGGLAVPYWQWVRHGRWFGPAPTMRSSP